MHASAFLDRLWTRRSRQHKNVSTQPPTPHSEAGGTTGPADDVAAPPPSEETQLLPEEDAPAATASPPEPVSPGEPAADEPPGEPADDTPEAVPRSRREVVVDELRYWRRTAVLGVIAGALYALTRWDQSRIPSSRRPRTGSR